MLRPPARQTATDTIATLTSRLANATLLEDRRAAVLGLRSFAKQFSASVASGALKDLIACLHKDAGDLDTIKIVLETLLMLFEPDESSPEASDEITLWLADQFSQQQPNITALLDLLENHDFYPRLYALQILSHVSSARPERSQESVFAAPLGVSRITAVLDDKREAVRNEALMLLVALTPTSAELQKVVAFENAFDRIFAIIEAEGGLTHGSTTVQDCLSLLANLLKLNTSNQSYFREIGGVPRIAKLLTAALAEEDGTEGVSEWIKPQRDINIWGLMTLIQLFLAKGAQGTSINQNAFWQSGILSQILHLAFHPSFSISIRSKSLETCGDIIRANSGLQERFGDLGVHIPAPEQPQTNGHATPGIESKTKTAEPPKPDFHEVNVIEALLELALEPAPVSTFDVRLAACNCFKAFIEGHDGIRTHVLRRAIEGHKSGDDAIPNMLTVLLEPPAGRGASDPYQQWMAGVILLHLIYDDSETKTMALKVAEGDADNGEEVVTFIQSIASNIIAGVQHVEDERALLGFLMLLSIWLFEEPEAVNDFLGEGTNVQGLIAAVRVSSASMPLVAGLAALLIGIVYEFSTKDSPVPRSTLHSLLISNLGRETYVDRLTKLRENVYVRDFEVLPQSSASGLPEVFFDKTFVDFLKDNFSRLLRAVDRDPKFEVSIVSNGVQKGVSRDLVDGLRAELEETKRNLDAGNNELLELRRKLEDEELEHRRTRESSSVELSRIKQINQSLHSNHEDEVKKLQQDHLQDRQALQKSHDQELNKRRIDHSAAMDAAQRQRENERSQAEQVRRATEAQHTKALNEAEGRSRQSRERDEAEIKDLKQQIAELQKQLSKLQQEHSQDLQTAHEEYNTKSSATQARLERAEERAEDANLENKSLREKLEEEKSKTAAVQTELDDLLVVFGDLEAKRMIEKARLKDLGETVSEDEDEGDAEEEDDADEDDVD
jgi:intracellular protein transport protein USO1